MEVLAHSFGVTVFAGTRGPKSLSLTQFIRFAAARSHRDRQLAWPNGFVEPRQPDPNP